MTRDRVKRALLNLWMAAWRALARRYYREDWATWPPTATVLIRRRDPLWWLWVLMPAPSGSLMARGVVSQRPTRQKRRLTLRKMRSTWHRAQVLTRKTISDFPARRGAGDIRQPTP